MWWCSTIPLHLTTTSTRRRWDERRDSIFTTRRKSSRRGLGFRLCLTRRNIKGV
uniref:Uncharacterized protein n=1 Tax=Cucumis melo TaxID=3656 RepID=A0A9I9EE87_CUCME